MSAEKTLTEKEYRDIPAISRSELFLMAQSPEKFKYARENPSEPTPALLLGQVFHKMVLQPDTLTDEYAKCISVDRRTKQGKEEFDKFFDENKEKIIIGAEMWEKCSQMADAVAQNHLAKKLLSGEKEVPFFWTDDLTGEKCKCRADCITQIEDMTICVDVKSASDASSDAFMKAAIKHGYDLQAGMYTDGITRNINKDIRFVFLIVEKEPPYAINIMQADELFVKRGYDLFREYIGMYHECKQTDNWYGYLGKSGIINNLGLPAYLAKEIE